MKKFVIAMSIFTILAFSVKNVSASDVLIYTTPEAYNGHCNWYIVTESAVKTDLQCVCDVKAVHFFNNKPFGTPIIFRYRIWAYDNSSKVGCAVIHNKEMIREYRNILDPSEYDHDLLNAIYSAVQKYGKSNVS